jgi:hypothetical protein
VYISITESFNGKMRDELLAGEIFNSLKEAQIPLYVPLWTRSNVSLNL